MEKELVKRSRFSSKVRDPIEKKINDGTYASILMKELFEECKEKNISDIHLEPMEEKFCIRVRINGYLENWKNIKWDSGKDLVLKIKGLSGMNVSSQDISQDGSFTYSRMKLRFRVILAPSYFGESVVLRVLNIEEIPCINNMRFSNSVLKDIKSVIRREQGLIILSGPTGSGKSSTMQAIIGELNQPEKKIISIENPVERTIEGVIHESISNNFSWKDSIKSAMRQDPDIIIIGEIRDRESANLAIEASMTGHLVVSTIHANSTNEIIQRLKSLEVDPFYIEKSIVLLTAQRLARKLCSYCKISQGDLYIKGAGCERCSGGIDGRIPIVETLREGEKHPRNTINTIARKMLNEGKISSEEYSRWRRT